MVVDVEEEERKGESDLTKTNAPRPGAPQSSRGDVRLVNLMLRLAHCLCIEGLTIVYEAVREL